MKFVAIFPVAIYLAITAVKANAGFDILDLDESLQRDADFLASQNCVVENLEIVKEFRAQNFSKVIKLSESLAEANTLDAFALDLLAEAQFRTKLYEAAVATKKKSLKAPTTCLVACRSSRLARFNGAPFLYSYARYLKAVGLREDHQRAMGEADKVLDNHCAEFGMSAGECNEVKQRFRSANGTEVSYGAPCNLN